MLGVMASRAVQHRQKALEQMHLKLTEVVSAMNGKTGIEMRRALLAGERDPQLLARHRDPRGQHDQATIAKALEGHWWAEHLVALRQALAPYALLQQQLRACETQIEGGLQAFVAHVEGGPPQTPPARKRRAHQRQAPSCDVHGYLNTMTGVDLTPMDGMDALTALKVISEIGLDMTRWPTGTDCASWLGWCPGTKWSGGKRYLMRSTPTANRAASA